MILVISFEGDEHTADVIGRLEAMGREVMLVDLAQFPASSALTLSWTEGAPPAYRIEPARGPVDLSRARVGWWRRVRPYTLDPSVAHTDQPFAHSETSQAVGGMLDALPCAWVNPRDSDSAAHCKPLQWTVAQQVGLRVPRTCVTNKPEDARAFIGEVGVGATVFKAFLASMEAWRETRLVEPQDLDRLEQVKYAPVIFQEYIPGVDLRVTIVGPSIFAAEIDARNTSYPVDMRMVVGEAVVQPVTLPPELETALLALQRRLNLVYGAIDLRRTPAGEYVFLEVNPAGQWHFVEQRTGLPISQAVANYLAGLDLS